MFMEGCSGGEKSWRGSVEARRRADGEFSGLPWFPVADGVGHGDG